MSASKRPLLRFALLVATLVLVACRAPEGAERAVQRVSITTNYALASGATLERVGPGALEVGAASSLDAAFVQGYATARFQLDELLAARAQSRGRARIGAGLDDRFVAALDLRTQATAAAEALEDIAPDALSQLWAYAHGVNTALIEEKGRQRDEGGASSEAIAASLVPWDAQDSLAILLYVLMAQSFDAGSDLCRFVRAMSGAEAQRCLQGLQGGVFARAERLEGGVRVCHSFAAVAQAGVRDEGADVWFPALPMLRWSVEVDDGVALDGWAPAGLPWLVTGTNGAIAWSLAGSAHDVTDFFYLSPDPNARRVPLVGASTSIAEEVAFEERRICEGDESVCDLRVRWHPEAGIIVNELLPGELRRAIDLVGTFSVNWSGLGAQLRETGAMSDLMEAGDLDVARSVLEQADTGAQRWLVASREAGSEWVDVGRVPSRPRPDVATRGGALDGRGMDLWQGYIPARLADAQQERQAGEESAAGRLTTCWRLGETGFLLEERQEPDEELDAGGLIELSAGFPQRVGE